MAKIRLTKKHQAHLIEFIRVFRDRSIVSEAMPLSFKMMIHLVYNMAVDDIRFSQRELDIIVLMMDCYFNVFTKNDIDPLMEECYARLVGHWPFDIPYYDRPEIIQDAGDYESKRNYYLGM